MLSDKILFLQSFNLIVYLINYVLGHILVLPLHLVASKGISKPGPNLDLSLNPDPGQGDDHDLVEEPDQVPVVIIGI